MLKISPERMDVYEGSDQNIDLCAQRIPQYRHWLEAFVNMPYGPKSHALVHYYVSTMGCIYENDKAN